VLPNFHSSLPFLFNYYYLSIFFSNIFNIKSVEFGSYYPSVGQKRGTTGLVQITNDKLQILQYRRTKLSGNILTQVYECETITQMKQHYIN
jgi:hypothetical protein